MKLKEMKEKTYSLIEEYYPEEINLAEDTDVINKMNGVVNQIIMDLMTYRKIPAVTDITVEETDSKTLNLNTLIEDMYLLSKVRLDIDPRTDEEYEYENPFENIIELPDDYVGNVKVYYYRNPTLCTTEFTSDAARAAYDNTYEFDLDPVLLEIMPYGIAADLLKMDMISNYGQYFYNRYLEMKQKIDPRHSAGTVRIVGGYNG